MYFRALDDAAFFAGNSRVADVLVLTVSFTIHFARTVTTGEIHAKRCLLHESGRLFLAEAELLDAGGTLLGRGSGICTRSAIRVDSAVVYA